MALHWKTNHSDLNILRSELLLWIDCKKNVCISFIKSGFFYYLCCLNLFSSQKSCPFQVFDGCKRKIWRHIFLLYPKLKLDLIMPRCFYVLIWSPYSPRRRLLSVSTIASNTIVILTINHYCRKWLMTNDDTEMIWPMTIAIAKWSPSNHDLMLIFPSNIK